MAALRHVYACGGKTPHATMGAAKRELRTRPRRVQSSRATESLHAYKCGRCGFFHIGHTSSERKKTALSRR